MENLEELKKKYEELGKEIERLENQKKNKRWRADKMDRYFYISNNKEIVVAYETGDTIDNFRYKSRNYFKTEKEAQQYLDNLGIYYDLMDLAEELNNGEKIDWNDITQTKHYIGYDFSLNQLRIFITHAVRDINQIYCLDELFCKRAIEKIGEKKLEKLFKEEK